MPRWADEPVIFDRTDTLQSILAKLDSATGGAPVVVLSSGCRIADNPLTYRVLERASRQMGAPIAVVSGNPLWRQLAREHGLHAFGSLRSLRRSRRRNMLSTTEGLLDSFLSSLAPSLASHAWVLLGALVVVGALVAAGTYYALPVMKVTVQAPVESLSSDLSIQVDTRATGVDAAAGMIPGRVVEHRFSISDYVETTGEKMVGRGKAKGEVTLINSGPGVAVLPAGTLLSTDTGIRFSTLAPVAVGPFAASGTPTPIASGSFGSALVTPASTAQASPTPRPPSPAAGTPGPSGTVGPMATLPSATSGVIARVSVAAVEPGEKGNVPPLAISRVESESFRGITAFNEQALSGGTDEKVRVASAEDRARLKETLFQRAQSQSLSELTVRLRQSESLIPSTMQVRIDREEYDKEQDQEGDRIRGTVSVVSTVLAYANQDLNSLAERQWKASVSKGYRPLAGAIELSTPEVVESDDRMATLKIKAVGKVERMLEADQMVQTLQGLSVEDARARISKMDNPPRTVSVEIWPDWAKRAYRVEVETVQ